MEAIFSLHFGSGVGFVSFFFFLVSFVCRFVFFGFVVVYFLFFFPSRLVCVDIYSGLVAVSPFLFFCFDNLFFVSVEYHPCLF